MVPVLELRGAAKRYGPITALHPTDLAFRAGSVTALIGPSGSGKSTLLRLLNGLLWPDSGEVLFEGRQVTPKNVVEVRRAMGYVVQDGGLFPHLTAAQNVTLLARYLRWPDEQTAERLESLCGLTHFPRDGLGRYPAQLSGGQQQRVSLMRALMLDPAVLLLDEPLGALDPMIRSDLQSDLREVFRSLGKTVVLVTHDLAEASYLGDDLVLLRDGSIVQHGALDSFLDAPADPFVSRFVRAQRSLLPPREEGRR